MLTGCITNSGQADYMVKPYKNEKGELVCCEAKMLNSKDYENVNIKYSNKGGEINFELNVDGISASNPQAIQAENNSKLLDAVLAITPRVGQ